MIELSLAFVGAAFIAGILMFLAPCTLPLVPAYLAFISGVKADTNILTSTERKKIITNALAFTVGFTIIFVGFGLLAGLAGFWAGQFRGLLSQIGGVFIIIFAMMMLNIIRFAPLLKNRTFTPPKVFTPGTPLASGLIGSTFALGWTPCVGPILASILLLASSSTTALSGALLLLVFSLGLAIPFMLVALLYSRASTAISKFSSVASSIQVVGGIFLLVVGVLLLTESFGFMVEYGYRVFNWFGFEGLFEYL